MKKCLMWFLMCLASVFLVACQGSAGSGDTATKPRVTVTTSFLYDMVNQLVGDQVALELLIPAGEDPHVYLAKSSDLKKLQEADLVLYHGLHFEGKMIEALEQVGVAVTKDFSENQLHTMVEDGESFVDPHFWFDIALYKTAVMTASKELQGLLPDQAEEISENETAYLADLDQLYVWAVEELSVIPESQRYLVTPHDAFQYFASNYGFTLYAPQGISTDSEVANKDMIETVQMIVDKKIPAIFTESTTNPARMKKLQEAVAAKGAQVAVISGEGQELFSDSLAPQGEDGDTYIDMYRHNIRLIVAGLTANS